MQRLFLSLAVIVAFAAPAHAWDLTFCANPSGLPYSSKDGNGFENRIAQTLADELGATARFVWIPNYRLRTARGYLHSGDCDAVMGVLDGHKGYLTSHAYYRSVYMFVVPENGVDVASLDDPALGDLRIGVPGGGTRIIPPAISLLRRGHKSSMVMYGSSLEQGEVENRILDDLEAGALDLAILWGPVAGQLARDGLRMSPVSPEIDIPFLPMVASFSVGLRPHDEAFRDALDVALAVRWDEVQAILADAKVPLLNLPQPVAPGEVR